MHASGHSLWASIAIILSLAMAGCTAPQESQDPPTQDAQEAQERQAPQERSPTGEAAPQHHAVATTEDLQWQEAPPSLPAGARIAVLSGDPAGDGPFTMRAEFPAGYEVPPHTHPSTEHVTILEGTAHLSTGEGDRASASELPAGSFFMMPPGTVHAFYTGDEPVVLQLHGTGPWGIEYVDPADDPRQE